MKIRCKNCYRILNPQEEYCTHCGEHSAEIEKAMKTGVYDLGETAKLKVALNLFILIAFIGSGLFMVLLAIFQNDFTGAYRSTFCRLYSYFATTIILLFVLLIVYRKELKEMMFNGTKIQTVSALIIALLFAIFALLLSNLTGAQIIPAFMSDFLKSGDATWFGGGFDGNIIIIIISLCAGVVCEEIIFRRRLIDALDEGTLLGDGMIIFLSSIVATFLQFAWLMSVEILIISFIAQIVFSTVYLYTNRSIGINIIVRSLLVIASAVVFIL